MEEEERENLESFLKWASELGISDSNQPPESSSCLGQSLCVSFFPDAGGRGLAAARDLRKGELILRVPKSALMTRESLMRDEKLSVAVNKYPSLSSTQVSIPMESEGTSQSEPTSRRKKQDRRLWTFAEEEALLAAMMECICDKYRAHNGFKPGYFNEVEKELKKRLPGTTLKAQPNIESKVKNWKEKYSLIVDITRLSGFGWNHTTNAIVVDDENVWKEYEKSNTRAKGLNGKSFPMYESWQFLFGRDRATGDLAEDAAEVDEVVETPQDEANIELDDMLNECYTPTFANGDTVFPREAPFVDISTSSGTPTSNANAPRTNANTPRTNANAPTSNVVPGRPKKKAKVDTNEASIHVAVENLLAQTNTAFNKIADAVGYEDRLSSKREKVFTELMKLDLEMIDRFALNSMIVSAEENVDTFYGIPENYKQAWVEAVLSGQIKLKTT